MPHRPASPAADHPYYTPANWQWQSSTGHLLAIAHHSMRRALDAELAGLGDVSSAQWIVLMILAHHDDVTAADLAKRLSHDPGSMTRLLDRLEEKRLICRSRTSADRRRIQIELTDEGRALAPSLPLAAIAVINRTLAGFTPDEHALLNRLLERMNENLKDPS